MIEGLNFQTTVSALDVEWGLFLFWLLVGSSFKVKIVWEETNLREQVCQKKKRKRKESHFKQFVEDVCEKSEVEFQPEKPT